MTRKCALCKETNYKKNKCSFFSAPKDAETRRNWQIALGINNYTVTDDTYICSKHFHRNDIITHWISGVPPQEIKIKYKKCRLRPGAVPCKNIGSISDTQSTNKRVLNECEVGVKNSLTCEKKKILQKNKTFLIPRKEKNLNDTDTNDKDTDTCSYIYPKSQTCVYNYDENDKSYNVQLSKSAGKKDVHSSTDDPESKRSRYKKKKSIEKLEYDNNSGLNLPKMTVSIDVIKEKNQIFTESIYEKIYDKTMEYDDERYDSSSEDGLSIETCERRVISKHYAGKKIVDDISRVTDDDSLRVTDDLYVDNTVLATLDVRDTTKCDEIDKNEILFEDFLEICTEASIPRGWSCLVTSKGHNTTVVYLCMDITKGGLPYVEKQIFIKNDMILHYATANREIDPLMHNLIKDWKCNKVRSLLDIEIIIDEFNQRNICQGIYDPNNYEDADIVNVAFKDGVKWRHVSCPLVVNNNSSRCTKCTALSHMLLYKS